MRKSSMVVGAVLMAGATGAAVMVRRRRGSPPETSRVGAIGPRPATVPSRPESRPEEPEVSRALDG